jgi:hypothetical protein
MITRTVADEYFPARHPYVPKEAPPTKHLQEPAPGLLERPPGGLRRLAPSSTETVRSLQEHQRTPAQP